MNTLRGSFRHIVMVAISILAVAAVAIPAWQRHLIRGRVADALKSTDAAKLVVTEAAVIHHGLSGVKATGLGYNPSTAAGPHVASVKIADGGRIILTTRYTGAESDLVLILTPKESAERSGATSISWNCRVASGNPSYVPASCLGPPATSPEKPANAGSTNPARPSP